MRLGICALAICMASALVTTVKAEETIDGIIQTLDQTVFAACSDGQETVVVGWQYLADGKLRGLGRLAGSDLRLDEDRLTAISPIGVWVMDRRKLVWITDDNVQSFQCSLIGPELKAVFHDIDWAGVPEQRDSAVDLVVRLMAQLEETMQALRSAEEDLAAANKSVAVKTEWIRTLGDRMQAAEARVRELEGK